MENMTAQQLIKKLVEERDIAIGQLQSLGLQLGQNTDKAKAAIDKQDPMKPKVGYAIILHDVKKESFACPVCRNSLWRNQKHCEECGQNIDWSGEHER